MRIKTELFANAVRDCLVSQLPYMDIDIDEIANTTAIKVLSEIQEVLMNSEIGESDFDIVEKIVCIFEKYNLNGGVVHDF